VQTYLRSGSTWKQGPTLTGRGEPAGGGFGNAVALSADGRTVLIAGQDLADPSKAWVLIHSGSSWAQTRLEGNGALDFGGSVALSGNGQTALIAESEADHNAGTVYVYTHTAGSWNMQKAALAASGEIGKSRFGTSISLSTDGRTALVGGSYDSRKTGAAWIFTTAR
jgi:hypothetical protein